MILKKPLIMARKKNKLPGHLLEKKYGLEYGEGMIFRPDRIHSSSGKFEEYQDREGPSRCSCEARFIITTRDPLLKSYMP